MRPQCTEHLQNVKLRQVNLQREAGSYRLTGRRRPEKVGGALYPGRGRCAPRRQSLLRSCLAAHSFPRRPPAYVLSAVGTPGDTDTFDAETSRLAAPTAESESETHASGEAPSCGGSPREGARSEVRAEQ